MGFENDAIVTLYRRLLDAWNNRDAGAFADLFSPTGSIVGFDGSMVNGREKIDSHLRPIFSDHPTARYVAKVRDIRQLDGDVAMLRAVAGMVPPGKDVLMPDRNAVQTLIASRDRAGGWRIEMFQNTPARFDGRPEEAQRLTSELVDELARGSGARLRDETRNVASTVDS